MSDKNYEETMKGMVEKELGRQIMFYLDEKKFDWNSILEKKSLEIVDEITQIFQSAEAYPDDQKLVDDIMAVLHKNGISTGVCHEY